MGRAKEEMMRYEELEPMYEWIEENYGDDAGEEGSETWAEAVEAYERFCDNLRRLEEEAYWQEEFDYYIYLTLKDADAIFRKDISELKAMLDNNDEMIANKTYLKMVFAHAVTLLEVYLEDITKSLILTNNAYLSNTIKSVKPFCDTAFKLADISLEKDGIKKFVIEKISDNLFHDIPKVTKVISGVVGKKLDVPISDVCKVTSVRHDIVHRNGKNREGKEIDITLALVKESLMVIEHFANSLRQKIAIL